MPIKVPNDLPVRTILEQENIFVMDENRAIHQDIRPIQNAAEYKLRCYTNKKPHYANEKRARSIYGKTHPVELFRSEESLGHELDTLMFEEDDELIAFINS